MNNELRKRLKNQYVRLLKPGDMLYCGRVAEFIFVLSVENTLRSWDARKMIFVRFLLGSKINSLVMPTQSYTGNTYTLADHGYFTLNDNR